MNKAELVEHVSVVMGVTKAQASTTLAAVIDSIKDGIVKDGEVNIAGFGKFEVRERKARVGRNPKTGEQMDIPASRSVGFKVSSTIKNSL